MKIGDDVFVINVWEQDGNYESNYRTKKRAQVLQLIGHILEINSQDNNSIKYIFGSATHSGEIGFDCFLTMSEAKDRVQVLNNYFHENNCLIDDTK